MKVLGIDEAGKGPVIGPMIVAGILTEYNSTDLNKKPENFKDIEIKDSKKLRRKKHQIISKKIKETSNKYVLIDLRPPHIDKLRQKRSMNQITVDLFSEVINRVNVDLAIVDAADVDSKRFKLELKKRINKETDIISEHKADEKYPIVSAASILAKNKRDKEIEIIEKKINEKIGKGYPSNKRTINFLKSWLKKKDSLPVFCRKSWRTSKELLRNKDQKNLEEF